MKNLLKQRSSVYGDFEGGIKLRSAIMSLIKQRHLEINKQEMSVNLEYCIFDIVNKLTRLAVTPQHLDSWRDIEGYSNLIYNYIKGGTDANK